MTYAFSPSSMLCTTHTSNVSSTAASSNGQADEYDEQQRGLRLGFIGCGTIAAAIVTGLLTQTEVQVSSVIVSRRSESKSTALVEKFGNEKIQISDDNQFIVDNCDILFLCVLPAQEEQVLTHLKINEEKILVSLVSTSKLETLRKNSGLDPDKIYKMICLPAVAQLEGTPILVPHSTNDGVKDLLSTLGGGTCIECENEDIMESMMVPTAMMGPVYGLMRQSRDFLIKKGVPAKDASQMVGRQYWAMVKDALMRCEDPDSLDDLIEEQTPGGLNEQTLKNLEGVGFLNSYNDAMEAVLQRIKGETDGSMKSTV
eukprot:CAMPEP_0203677642 /NCGR_PEP_ID=MMETSP0090-20130426/28969_1 /ASSEMBLY_ACC=CAM_ASM_001088 /TAXON_ID=426623 /ORGANISM="Chaetoceros affinis, Strain CCMP159" /LENGTH=313 /DNA_ID=CAMNT_0050544595 /DNA_START=76 /DNA_END=1017 /DNA_ORIENTATION=-